MVSYTPEKITNTFEQNRETVRERLQEFESLREDASNTRLFKELVFVILTSQSDALDCWNAVNELDRRGILRSQQQGSIEDVLVSNSVSYESDKAEYIVQNYKTLRQPTLSDPSADLKLRNRLRSNKGSVRDSLTSDLEGVGYKAASHFLRNTGFKMDIAILSSPVVEALKDLGYSVQWQPGSRQSYLENESVFIEASEDIGLSPQELDLSIWAVRSGKVFK